MKKKKQLNDQEILAILSNTEQLTQILQQGIKAALLQHKRANNPVCTWGDGKVKWILPANIPVTDDDDIPKAF